MWKDNIVYYSLYLKDRFPQAGAMFRVDHDDGFSNIIEGDEKTFNDVVYPFIIENLH